MQKTKIVIVTSADESSAERLEISDFFRHLNECYVDKGHFFTLAYNAASETDASRKPDYGAFDLAFYLLSSIRDTNQWESYDAALESYNNTGKPQITLYASPPPAHTTHRALTPTPYINSYTHIDTLKLGILMQIKQLDLPSVDITLENGKARQGGYELMRLDNVEAVSGYESLQQLKLKHSELEDSYYAAKARHAENPEDSEAYEAFFEIAKRRNDAMTEIRDTENKLFSMLEGMYEQTAKGKLTKRQLEGYRLVEQGRLREALAVIDIQEIISDSRHIRHQADDANRRAMALVNELLQLCEVNIALSEWENAEKCFREAVSIEEKFDTGREAGIQYLVFLSNQHKLTEGINIGERILYHLRSPASNAPDADVAKVCACLGGLYRWTQRYDDAVKVYETSIRIYEEMWKPEPTKYASRLADAYRGLADIYNYSMRFFEAKSNYQKAIDLHNQLISSNSQNASVTERLAVDLYRFAILNHEHHRREEAEQHYRSALELQKGLADTDPERYARELAHYHNGLGCLLYDLGRLDESESILRAGLDIHLQVVSSNPDSAEVFLSECYNFLGNTLLTAHRLAPSEEMLRKSAELRKRWYLRDPDAARYYLSCSYSDLACVCQEMGRTDEAEKLFSLDIALSEELVKIDRDVNAWMLGAAMNKMGELYMSMGRLDEAEEIFRKALPLLEQTEAVHTRSAMHAGYLRDNIQKLEELKEDASLSSETKIDRFTPEEGEIALMLTEGATHREIARKYGLSAAEVKKRIESIRAKVIRSGAKDRTIAAVTNEYKLTRRETEVLRLLRKNAGNDVIAEELVLSEDTVRFHVRNVLRKLSIESRQDVAKWIETFETEQTADT